MSLEEKIKKHEETIYTTAFATAALAVPGMFVPTADVTGILADGH